MYNRIILVGNLTRDIELRYTPSRTAIANCGIATNRKYKKQDGTQGEEVCFIDITFFGRSAEIANQYLKKGSKVLVEGRLKLDRWTDNNGQNRSKHSVMVESMKMLSSEKSNDQPKPKQQTEIAYEDHRPKQPPIPEIDIDDDEIPF